MYGLVVHTASSQQRGKAAVAWLHAQADLLADALSLYHNCDSTMIRLRYDDDTMQSTTTEVIEITTFARFDCDATTTRLRRKIDMIIFARVEWKQARAIRRSRIVVVSQSNRNFDHFRCNRMRRGIVVYDVS